MGVVQSNSLVEESKPQEPLKIKLKTPVAQYFALRLLKQHTAEQQAVQQNKDSIDLQDFNISQFSRLVNKFSNSIGLDLDSDTITNPTLNNSKAKFSLPIYLTDSEISLAIKKIGTPNPNNLEEVSVYNQMIKDFNKCVKSAKNMEKIKDTINTIKGFLTGKIKPNHS